jgi:hypothetical protein
LKKYNIKSIMELKTSYSTDAQFKEEWIEIWRDLAKADGGKISLTTMGIIIGSVLGGVGIAAMGGAIGMPLALVLGLGGFLFGSIIDDENKIKLSITLPDDILERLEKDAQESGIPVNKLIEYLVIQAYNLKN